MFTTLQYQLLRRFAPREAAYMSLEHYDGSGKVAALLGKEFLDQVAGRVVVDFGCGEGRESVELAQHGAIVYGVDIDEAALSRGRENARAAGVADRCTFGHEPAEPADLILSIDAFEHFGDPGAVLDRMYDLLKPGGAVVMSFGPLWYHPYGGHLFSVFPWAHLLFSEEALIRWRSHLRDDGATRFCEVAGGLNQMTIRRFERLVRDSRFELVSIEPIPIRRLRWAHARWTRELTTSVVRCRLRRAPG